MVLENENELTLWFLFNKTLFSKHFLYPSFLHIRLLLLGLNFTKILGIHKLQVGDLIFVFTNNDGEFLFFFIIDFLGFNEVEMKLIVFGRDSRDFITKRVELLYIRELIQCR